MADRFGHFRLAINDPEYFFGRQELLTEIRRSPVDVRIILGGRRLGKTSLLNAIRWTLLSAEDNDPNRVLPVLFNLQQEQPKSLDNFRYLLINRLKETIENPEQTQTISSELRQNYRRFLRQISGGGVKVGAINLNISNPDQEQLLIHEDFSQDLIGIFRQLQKENCQGVCFLFDGAEYIVKQDWADDAWSYLRSLKDTGNIAIQPFLGLILSGYRDLKEYQQEVSSPLLNISKISWLSTLNEAETQSLIRRRCQDAEQALNADQLKTILAGSGCHPYLTNQMLNAIFENKSKANPLPGKILGRQLIKELRRRDFPAWWDEDQKAYGFGEKEQSVYLALAEANKSTADELAETLEDMSIGKIEDALEVLAGTGVIRQLDYETYAIGSKLFEQWVREEKL